MLNSINRLIVIIVLIHGAISYHPIVNQLQSYVESNQTFARLLNDTYLEVDPRNPINYNDMYVFFDSWLTLAQNVSNWTFSQGIFKYGTFTPTGSALLKERKSQEWLQKYLVERKKFCDSPNSSYIIPYWEQWDMINMSEYIIPQSGYQNFNQFFTRQIKQELRPIDSPNNDSIIVSPCDGSVIGYWLNNITLNSNISVKGETYNVSYMLSNEKYSSKYEGGSLIHIALETYNYHRYHTSVSGYAAQIDQIGGYIYWQPANATGADEWIFWVNENRRGALYVDNENIGIVAHVYVGVTCFSSVNIHIDAGISVKKGEETGYFKYGGSSIVLVFEPGVIEKFLVDVNEAIQLGQRIAIAKSKQTLSMSKYEL